LAIFNDRRKALTKLTNPGITSRRFFTRKEAAQRVRDHGIPLTDGTFENMCCRGAGPEPDSQWGRRILYTPEKIDGWIADRLRKSRDDAA
jgi:hypothetical protein